MINQVFALFQVNYHNQYFSAFGDNTRPENLAKKLWLGSLDKFSVATIYKAAEKIILDSEYLPTLHKMSEACRTVSMPEGLPSVRQAYLEACTKAHPKIHQHWSHPIVYLAARDCGWYALANSPESQGLTAFRPIYYKYCDALIAGSSFSIERPAKLPETSAVPASKEEAKKHLNHMKDLFR